MRPSGRTRNLRGSPTAWIIKPPVLYANSQGDQAAPRFGSVSRWWVSAVNVLQLTSTEDMKMQVRNRLPAALAHVCRYAVTLSDSFGVGDLTSKSESLAKKWIMLTAQVMNGRDVVSCHNEDVNRGPRELVPESDNVISLRHPHGRLLASHYPTEQARVVVHVSSEARFYCLRPQYTEGCRQSPRGHMVERVTVPEHPGQRGHSHVRWSMNRSASRGRGATTVTSQANRRPSRIACSTRSASSLRSPSGTTSQRTTSRCSMRSMIIR